ncbi:MAG: type II toxin-antitoxin system HicB family antitoxin [Bacteroidetes bacterium]|nr:type II toxin-antitoxin system HicB family antitoxin [Bacteroidota bacterium]
MKYKEYSARIEFDEHDRLFYGEVLGIRDIVTFHGRSVRELERAFKDSVDDYVDLCRTRGEEPDRPFSGKFVVRIDPDIHRRLAIQAAVRDESLNTLVARVLGIYVATEGETTKARKHEEEHVRLLKRL